MTSEVTGTATGPSSSGPHQGGSYLPWHLIPVFKPGETDINDYSRRMTFLSGIWPGDQLSLLAPRAALACEGSAFQKVVRLDPAKLKVNSVEGVQLLVKTLGGTFGKTTLENRFERFERAIYTVSQKTDESHESYVARHEVQFEDLLSQGILISDVRAYVLLRNSGLTAEEKKRVIIDAGGDLSYDKVIAALRLLGSKFFHEVQTGSKSGHRSKTYDVNMTQEEVPEAAEEGEEVGLFTSSAMEDYALEVLYSEGDNDAMVVAQFEEQILEALQNDPEVASCLNTYLDARRRLSDKAKHRGFWGASKGGKGKGRGKSKSSGKGNRRSLEWRIANSFCKACGQQGHWKAECPNRSKTDGPPGSAFAGVAAMDPSSTTWDIIEDQQPPDEAVAFVLQAGIQKCQKVPTHHFRGKLRGEYVGLSSSKTKCIGQDMHMGCLRRLFDRTTVMQSRSKPPDSIEPLSPSKVSVPTSTVSVEDAHFVSQGMCGIVDLGASLSVIGENQFRELCSHLPQTVLRRMKEAPCSVNFRFGNDSTVQGRRAVYIPLKEWWLKIIVVPSNTPFLIANSVFRALEAVIDTGLNQIHFRKLNCTVPITLTDRKLYLLDLESLLSQLDQSENGERQQPLVCQCTEDNQTSKPTKEVDESKCSSEKASHVSPKSQCLSVKKPRGPGYELKAHNNGSVRLKSCSSNHSTASFDHGSIQEHGLHRSGSSIPSSFDRRSERAGGGRDPTHDVCTAERSPDGLWQGKVGTEVFRGGSRPPLRPMVHGDISTESKPKTPSIPEVRPTACGSDGRSETKSSQIDSEFPKQGQSPTFDCSHNVEETESNRRASGVPGVSHRDGVRGRGDRGMGASPYSGTGTTSCRRNESGSRSFAADGARDATGVESSQPKCIPEHAIKATGSHPDPVIIPSPTEARWEVIHHLDDPQENLYSIQENWVAQELWNYLRRNGITTSQIAQNKSHLLEVYCSSESSLTEQCVREGMIATRFGLRQGDLSTIEGRQSLYQVLVTQLPRHIWMSPKCKAWCKWNIFNMQRSRLTAQKVIQAREDERVHLLLCDALFQFQQWRHANCHAHLEQPRGSQLVHQEEMQRVLDTTLLARCDMCVAGQLRHPETLKLLQKGTQVLTTSPIMHRMLEQLRCDQSHPHDRIEGSIKSKQGDRVPLSQFTELYTRKFAQKLCRAIRCSVQARESRCMPSEIACTLGDGEETEPKRRRLEDKQPPTRAYVELERQQIIQNIIAIAKCLAPKVGKIVVTTGDIIQRCQSFWPDFQITSIELCKGADRLRPPPNGVNRQSGAHRFTIGCHRNEEGHFLEPWEDWTQLSRKQLIRKCLPSRLLITVFAGRVTSSPKEPDTAQELPRHDIGDEPVSKRHKTSEDHQTNKNPEEVTVDNNPEVTSYRSHGPRFRQLPSSVQSELMKIHKNLGHPDPKVLSHALKDQGWDKNCIEGLQDMVCPTCHEQQKPKLARPGHLDDPKEFNELVLIDGIDWTNQSGTKYHFVHVLDVGTNFHIAFVVPDRTTTTLIEHFQNHWILWAGSPKAIMTDSAGEFCSDEFGQFLQSHDTRSIVVPADAHWQLGRCERHGAILQSMLDKYQVEHPIVDPKSLQEALVHCTQSKNSLARYKGYTPEILVLGKSRHQIGSNSDEDKGSAQWIPGMSEEEGTETESQEFLQRLARREAAKRAFVSADNCQKIRRASLRRSRPSRGSFSSGQWVMFWRNRVNSPGQWIGPAKVVLSEDQNVIWVTHMSRLYRCSPENLRYLSEREYQESLSLPQQAPLTLPSNLGTGVFQYTDLHQQNPPNITTEIVQEPNNAEQTTPGGNSGLSNPDQPDSEPEGSGEAATESGINPSGNLLPETVPLPEDAEEGLMTWGTEDTSQYWDHWKWNHHQLIRVHREPRYKLFCPTNVAHSPIPPEWLEPQRTTRGKFHNHQEWDFRDKWFETVDAHAALPMHWYGESCFVIKPEYRKQASEIVYQASIDETHPKGWSISIELDQEQLNRCLELSEKDQVSFLATSAKKQRSEVREKDLTPGEIEQFLQAKTKEVTSWLSTHTVRKIAREQIPEEQILRSRWVLTWKPIDPNPDTQTPSTIEACSESTKKHKAKARLVILGFEDPQLESLARDSPTVGRDTRMLILQHAASSRHLIQSFDIQTAFLRGSRTDGRVLGMEPPPEMRLQMGLKPWECCELLKSAYGLVNAPLLWYEELKSTLLSLGFRISPLDPCLFVLPRSKSSDQTGIHGLIGVHVDDGLAAGDQNFQQALKALETKFPFGSKKQQQFVFTGIQVSQQPDFSIELDQERYVEDITPVNLNRERRLIPQELATDDEKQSLRALVGSLQYAATNTRPDISARLSFIQAKLNQAQIKDILDANKLLMDTKAHKDTKIVIKPIPLSDVRFLSFSDASFATRSNAQSQKGCLILAGSNRIERGEASDVSPLFWYSKKIARVVGSTLASEAYALSGALDVLSWMRLQWSWLCRPSEEWKNPTACLANGPKAYAIVDCKSLFDLMEKTIVPQCQEYRTAIEALIIKDRLKEGISVKWVHSAAQLADALTKIMDCSTLRQFLRRGRCRIHDADEILKQRADHRSKKRWQEQLQSNTGVETGEQHL